MSNDFHTMIHMDMNGHVVKEILESNAAFEKILYNGQTIHHTKTLKSNYKTPEDAIGSAIIDIIRYVHGVGDKMFSPLNTAILLGRQLFKKVDRDASTFSYVKYTSPKKAKFIMIDSFTLDDGILVIPLIESKYLVDDDSHLDSYKDSTGHHTFWRQKFAYPSIHITKDNISGWWSKFIDKA